MSTKENGEKNNLFEAAVIPRMQKAQEGIPVPSMQPIKANDSEQKGAPIPNMQPVQQTGNTQSGGNNQGSSVNQSTGGSSGQPDEKS